MDLIASVVLSQAIVNIVKVATQRERPDDKRQFMSDVVFGSTVGIIAGRTVTRPDRESPAGVQDHSHGAHQVDLQRMDERRAS